MFTGSLQAAPIFFDDFSSYTEGVHAGAMGPWTVSTTGSGRTLTIARDENDAFGDGASNQYVEFENTGTTAMYMALQNGLPSGNEVITLSFNWIFPELAGNTQSFSVRVGTNSVAGDDIANIVSFSRFTEGGTSKGKVSVSGAEDAIFDLNTPYRFDIVFNASEEVISYEDGTLGGKSYDVWIDGVKVASGLKSFDRFSGDITTISFRTDSNHPNLAYLNWVAVYAGAQVMAPIPEPSMFVFLGGAALGVIAFRRKKCA